jgi:hypothetical protein
MRRKKANLLRISFSCHQFGTGEQRFFICFLSVCFAWSFLGKETMLMMTDATNSYDMNISLLLLFLSSLLFYSSRGPTDGLIKLLDTNRYLL